MFSFPVFSTQDGEKLTTMVAIDSQDQDPLLKLSLNVVVNRTAGLQRSRIWPATLPRIVAKQYLS
jgi:hypothetical protein